MKRKYERRLEKQAEYEMQSKLEEQERIRKSLLSTWEKIEEIKDIADVKAFLHEYFH